ncbi:MAG: sugar kinase [Spirochaetales bacterium]
MADKRLVAIPEGKKYAIMTATSMGVRATPTEHRPMHLAGQLNLQVTSAESNVVTIPSSLGLPGLVLTKFVEGSPISKLIHRNLRSRGLEVEGPSVPQGGPWGYRHQFNLADTGLGARGPRVHNDRAGEVGRTINLKDFDIERILGSEGASVLHLSGLIAALSPEAGTFCLELARLAHKHGTLVSFDLNHRASFWKGQEERLRSLFREIAALSDLIVGNEEDFQLCLGVEGPEVGGSEVVKKIERFGEMIARVQREFPSVSVFATTLREVVHANLHRWGAILVSGDDRHVVEPREIPVYDRIGGGDAFVGGMLYGILRGWPAEDCLHFGWATGALAVTGENDYAEPADEEQVWNIWSGNARVRR